MTDEERQRQMDFILAQQAQLTATVGALAEAQVAAEKRWERTEVSIRNLLSLAEIHDREITATNEKLDALISTVERYIIGRDARE